MVYSSLYEILTVVTGLVQPDDRRYLSGLEKWNVRLRRERVVFEELVRLRHGSCEGYDLIGDNPGEIAVFDLGVEVVIVVFERV